jgi:hypothetical protein
MVNPKYYFQHDNHSREDEKLIEVRMKHQMAGIGVYWCLVEMLHEGNGYIETKPKLLAFQLQVDEQVINDVVEICFTIEDGKITSSRVKQNLKDREDKFKKKQEIGRQNVSKRWNKDTNTIPTDTTTIPNDSKVIPNHTIEKEKEKEKEKVIDKVKVIETEIEKRNKKLIEIFKYEIKENKLTKEQVIAITNDMLKKELNLYFNEKYPEWEKQLKKSDANMFCKSLEKQFVFDNFRIAMVKAYKFLNN